jgi:hypothetical protein
MLDKVYVEYSFGRRHNVGRLHGNEVPPRHVRPEELVINARSAFTDPRRKERIQISVSREHSRLPRNKNLGVK